MSKKEIRNSVLMLLKELDISWQQRASVSLCFNLEKLMQAEFSTMDTILAWHSFFPGEPDLRTFIDSQLLLRKVYLPRSLPGFTLNFILSEVGWENNLTPGIHGIPEPADNSNKSLKPEALKNAIILVPGLAFDRNGNRLGRGKGYYDRFLALHHDNNIQRIGVCWSMQVLDKVDTEGHDFPVDWLCTENEILKTT